MSRDMRSMLTTLDQDELAWHKSSASPYRLDCVEAAPVDGGMLLRDSTDPKGPILAFSDSEWNAFLTGVRNGEFDPS
ncbi:DUF397 domain-containing protein [Frankia sp. CNm7]|uniref:DUF397 domain-containing protein n=1 Tax=Frankia nepalensis TaxID=1836974 RepID=A0A937RRQ8_9ACTN|nr:DUF397 domain-containing protein [Frankia nepalensis]MBL7500627.1 DUF397 domain-containing protein [Frankia nepalensis]MBL7511412.1 DUF397 domain-containing protein [Frankia nepalensis]MBL7521755.1 DUF397 domain-containing protein [Frankia nepalensis]MBL7631508.1 DUF397 domain-containing protein [Frankia nepalensis]